MDGCFSSGSVLGGPFKAKVNGKTENVSHILNKAKPGSTDADGSIFEKEEQLITKSKITELHRRASVIQASCQTTCLAQES